MIKNLDDVDCAIIVWTSYPKIDLYIESQDIVDEIQTYESRNFVLNKVGRVVKNAPAWWPSSVSGGNRIKDWINKNIFSDTYQVDKTLIQIAGVQKALENIVKVSKEDGSKKGGVIWHTQGAGKSLEMTCLAGRLITDQRLGNPTIVMVTDRQDLDGQLFSVFNDSGDFLVDTPRQAETISELKELLIDRPSGGIIFTTIQKFKPEKDEEKFQLHKYEFLGLINAYALRSSFYRPNVN